MTPPWAAATGPGQCAAGDRLPGRHRQLGAVREGHRRGWPVTFGCDIGACAVLHESHRQRIVGSDRGVDQAECGQIADPMEGVRPGFTFLRDERVVRPVIGSTRWPDQPVAWNSPMMSCHLRGWPSAVGDDLLVVLFDVVGQVAQVQVPPVIGSKLMPWISRVWR